MGQQDQVEGVFSKSEWAAAPSKESFQEAPWGRLSAQRPEELAREQARKIVAEAREEAERILREARQQREAEAARLQDVARQELERSVAALLAEMQELFRRESEAVLEEVAVENQRRLAAVRDEVCEIVAVLTSQVVARVVEAEDEVVVRQVDRAVKELAEAKEVMVRVSPEAVDRLGEWAEKLRASGAAVTVLGDQSIGAGGALVETERGEVDARIERQLERVREALEAALGREEAADGPAAGL